MQYSYRATWKEGHRHGRTAPVKPIEMAGKLFIFSDRVADPVNGMDPGQVVAMARTHVINLNQTLVHAEEIEVSVESRRARSVGGVISPMGSWSGLATAVLDVESGEVKVVFADEEGADNAHEIRIAKERIHRFKDIPRERSPLAEGDL
jgi:hypothetical protein